MSPRVKATKAKKNFFQWEYIKLRNFCTAKEIINKMKKPTEWEKILLSNDNIQNIFKNSYN